MLLTFGVLWLVIGFATNFVGFKWACGTYIPSRQEFFAEFGFLKFIFFTLAGPINSIALVLAMRDHKQSSQS